MSKGLNESETMDSILMRLLLEIRAEMSQRTLSDQDRQRIVESFLERIEKEQGDDS